MKKSLLVAFLVAAFGLSVVACSPSSTSPLGYDCQKEPKDARCTG